MPGEPGLSEVGPGAGEIPVTLKRVPINFEEMRTVGDMKGAGYDIEEIKLYWAARGVGKGRRGIGSTPDETLEDQREKIENFLKERGVDFPPLDKLEETVVGMLANPQKYPVLPSAAASEVGPEAGELEGSNPESSSRASKWERAIGSVTPTEESELTEEQEEAGGIQEPGGQTPPTEEADFAVNPNLIPEKEKPFAKKLRTALWGGVKNWAKNLDPRGKDKFWRIGFAAGVVETPLFLIGASIPGLQGWLKAGTNLLLAQGFYGAARGIYSFKERQIKKRFSGDELIQKLEDLEKGRGSTMGKIKNVFLGVSAGATYASVTGLGIEAVKGVATGMNINLSEIKFPTVKPLREPMPVIIDETQMPVFVETSTLPSGDAGLADKLFQEKFETITKHIDGVPFEEQNEFYKAFVTQKAAEVGKELPITDKFIEEALKAKGQMLSDLDASSLEKARLALQHDLEAQANTSFDANLEVILKANPNLDLDTAINQAVGESHKSFETLLGTEQFQAHFSDVAQKAIAEQTALADALSMHISTGLEGQTKLFTDQAIKKGTTVGQLLIEKGHQVTWGAGDAKLFGAHIAANYDMLTDMWGKMADNKLILDKPFPIGLTELADLVKKAEGGDLAAIEKLKLALHWIPAGEKFRILTAAGVKKTLELLR